MARKLIVVALGILVVAPFSMTFAADSQPRLNRLEVMRANMSALRPAQELVVPQPETPEELLGSLLYSDKNLSLHRNQACSTCHQLTPVIDPLSGKVLPTAGFVDPDNVTKGTAVSTGSVSNRFGTLNTPSVGYAAFSPFFHWDAVEGLYVGGAILGWPGGDSAGTGRPPSPESSRDGHAEQVGGSQPVTRKSSLPGSVPEDLWPQT